MSVVAATAGAGAASAAILAAVVTALGLSVRSAIVRSLIPAFNLLAAVIAFGDSGFGGVAVMGAYGFGSWLVLGFVRASVASRRGRYTESNVRRAEAKSIGFALAATVVFSVLIAAVSQLSAPALVLPIAIVAVAAGLLAMGRSLAVSSFGGNDSEFRRGKELPEYHGGLGDDPFLFDGRESEESSILKGYGHPGPDENRI